MDDEIDLTDAELYANDSRGVYIPQFFAESVKRDCVEGVTEEQFKILLEGPNAEWYWETWDEVTNNAVLTDPTNGKRFYLYQDGDLWMVPVKEDSK